MILLLHFFLGLAFGSFINVLAVRYDPDHFLLRRESLGGRSRCLHCGKTLRWFELVPLLSFIIQRGKCRNCGVRLSFQYPLVELVAGLLFVFIPFRAGNFFPIWPNFLYAAFYILVFSILLLVSLVDLRLRLIPDEANIALALLGIPGIFFKQGIFGAASGSFIGPYALLFGLRENIWLNHLFAASIAALFFGIIIFASRGRAMGIGDLKLAIPLGLLFGWPDILILTMLSFIVGALVGIVLILRGKTKLKGTVPFGPFLAFGTLLLFFFGEQILEGYFGLIGL